MSQKHSNLSKKKKLLKTFFIASGVTLVICIMAIATLVITYNNYLYEGEETQTVFEEAPLTEEEQKIKEEKDAVSEINQTVAIFGVDADEVRTDVVLVVNFNSRTNKIKVVSIPRDTKVQWSDRQRSKYNQLTGYDISVSKLNEMSAYGRIYNNPGNIRDFTIDEIENILRVNIDNYVIINIEAFNAIVDAVGGVEVDVPQRMYYQDRSQNLYIDLQPGVQVLNGKQAEGLVRFRQYLTGDEQRISVQQAFLKALAQKVMSKEIFTKLPSLVPTLFSYVKTDIKLNEIFTYLTYLKDFNLSNLEFYTVPGEGSDREGPSYYFIDYDKMPNFIQEVFYDTTIAEEGEQEIEEEQQTEPTVDRTVTISVYNAAGVKGLAGDLKDQLEKDGYNVEKIGNYEKDILTQSVIYTKDIEKAEQFKSYVGDVVIQKDETLEYDIQIILGTEYTNNKN